MDKLTDRKIAGIFSGVGALLLIYLGEVALGAVILTSMAAYFVGENNGVRKANQ